ncbi:MAG TPA: 30S ribosomal protein S12 methylthiotransferase RimO, partial [Ruminococcaceae bacterium]|nr:30S ribosomal protein S12 methylthiotransferase RimO [Oscillospiraceae bacterium]
LRTTLIAGFPGETERQFGELCEFVKEMSFDRLGCFAYSKEEGTAAAKFENQIETKEKQRRQELIMQHQAALTEQNNALKAGTLMQVLVEGYDKELKCYFGRGRADAPEIDGMVYFTSKHILPTGSFAEVRIKDCIDYDFLGEAEEKHEESET